jgi:hypothetical protein
MLAIDGLHNGWRHLILPIAHSDELVMNAVLAVSASHLSFKESRHMKIAHASPQMAARSSRLIKADQYPDSNSLYAQAITSLLQRQDLSQCSQPTRNFVLLAILILLVAVMVTGSQDFPILFRTLQSAFEAVGGEQGLGNGELAQFIIRQIHK